MSIFKRKTKFENELNNDFTNDQNIIPLENTDGITPWSQRNISAKHALTKEEVLKKDTFKKPESAPNGSLFAKMAENLHSEDFFVTTSLEPEITDKPNTTENKTYQPAEPEVIKTEPLTEQQNEVSEKVLGYEDVSKTEIEKIPVYKNINNENVSEIIDSDSTKDEVSSLLEKCKNFIYDDSTEESELVDNAKEEPLYELESVDEILSSIKQKLENEKEPEPASRVNYITTSVSKESLESGFDDVYSRSVDLKRKEEIIPENIKTVRKFSADNSLNNETAPAREIPVRINVFDRAISEPVMVATKDNLDIGATRVLPDIAKTEVSLKSNDIQMSLADSGIVKAPVKVAAETVLPNHALYKKGGNIKKELLDEFFEGGEVDLPKPKYRDIISDSAMSQKTDKQSTQPFSLLDATNEFNKIEPMPAVEVEVPELETENATEPTSKLENLKAIAGSLNNSTKSLKFKAVPTAIITAVLLIISFLFEQSVTVNFVSLALFSVVCIINFDIIKSIISVFSANHGIDTPISFSCIAVFIQTVVCAFVLKTDFINLTGIAAFSVCADIFGKILTQTRIAKNITLLDNTNEKRTLKIIENCDSATKIAKDFAEGEASVGTVRPAVNLKGFAAASFESGVFENMLSKISLISVILSVVLGAIAYLLFKNVNLALTVLVISACVCYPPASLMILNLPLNSSANSLRHYGCAFSGFSGATEIERCNAITVNATELFPAGTVKLQKMYVLSENQVDNTFKCAAAVAKAANSPLAEMFAEIIAGEVNLPKAEDINYEDKMGISGWIKDKRILIGNRLLMEGHGINIPQSNIDRKILKAGYFPVYVAFDSRPCLLLICSYSVDQEISYNIRNICNLGITVLVNSCDPNTTEQMITDYFGLYEDSVKIITPSGYNALQSETEFCEDVNSCAVFGNSVNGFLKTFTVCNNLKSCATVMSVVHIFTIVLGLLGLCFYTFTTGLSNITSLIIFAYLLVSSGVTCFSFLFKKL